MLNKLKAKKAQYETDVLDYKKRIEDCEKTIDEYKDRIEEVKAKESVLDEIIAEEAVRSGVQEKQEVEVECVCDEEAEAETEAEEEQPKAEVIIFHYGNGGTKASSDETNKS